MSDAEIEKLQFEKDRWREDLALRERELDLKIRDQENKNTEISLKKEDVSKSSWRNPIVVAILTAAAAGVANLVVAYVNARSQNTLERERNLATLKQAEAKAESDRILEMIKTGNTETAAKNLEFLLDAGLVRDKLIAERIKSYLAMRKPGTGPSLPAQGAAVVVDRASNLSRDQEAYLTAALTRYANYLKSLGLSLGDKEVRLIIYDKGELGGDHVNAYYLIDKAELHVHRSISHDFSVFFREYSHHALLYDRKGGEGIGECAAVESGVADYLTASFLNDPRIGHLSAAAFGRSDFIRNLDNKVVLKDLGSNWQQNIHGGGMVFGAALWQMRGKWTSGLLDKIIVNSWLATKCGAENKMAAVFAKNLAGEVERVLSRAEARDAAKMLRERGFSL